MIDTTGDFRNVLYFVSVSISNMSSARYV